MSHVPISPHDIENTGPYNWKHTWNQTASNHPIHQHGHTKPEPRSSVGNTSSNPQVSVLIPRPVFNGMERVCQRHGSNQNSHPPVLVRKPLRNQFMHYHISSRGVFGINQFKLSNFAVVATECSFATVDRGSIMATIHRWSVMIYGSLQAEFMETKYNSHIHRYGTSVFGKIVVNISKSINNNNQIFWRL